MTSIFGDGIGGDADEVEVELELERWNEKDGRGEPIHVTEGRNVGRGFWLLFDCAGCSISHQFLLPWSQVANIAALKPFHIDRAETRRDGDGYKFIYTCPRCLSLYDGWGDGQARAESTTVINLTPFIPTIVETYQNLRAQHAQR